LEKTMNKLDETQQQVDEVKESMAPVEVSSIN
jgi:hypothetical protein